MDSNSNIQNIRAQDPGQLATMDMLSERLSAFPEYTESGALTRLPHGAELVDLYRQARNLCGADFAAAAFGLLRSCLAFDVATLLTSFADRPAYLDAHFHGLPDPAEVLESWSRVQHLDVLSPSMLMTPGRARRLDIDDPLIAGDVHAPLRAHLARFRFIHSAGVALPVDDRQAMTVLILVRRASGSTFSDAELMLLEQFAPHIAEASAVSRAMTLLRLPLGRITEMPLALIDAKGALAQATPAFVRLFWNGRTPQDPHLDQECLAAIRGGREWLLPDGIHVLRADIEPPGWLLRIQRRKRTDCLSERERTVASLFAGGDSHKEIARKLKLAPVTVRNHLRKIYAKLGVKHRVELITAIEPNS